MSEQQSRMEQLRRENGVVSRPGGGEARLGFGLVGGIQVLPGSPEPDRITGTTGDDLILSGGARSPHSENYARTERIDGGGGADIVILPGGQEEYVASMPQVGEYPSEASGVYEGRPYIYGSRIILTHVDPNTHAEQRFELNGIGRVGFDTSGQQHDDDPSNVIGSVRSGIANGSISVVTTDELRAAAESGMSSPEERRNARLAATIEATRVMDAALPIRIEESQQRALEVAAQAHPDIMNEPVVSPNANGRLDEQLGLSAPQVQPTTARPAPGLAPR